MQEDFVIVCPYCGETVGLFLEFDVEGDLVQDCEVCCRPWRVEVTRNGEEREVSVTRADGSD